MTVFIIAVIGFGVVLAGLFWFTGWAEQEIAAEPQPLEAKTK